MVGGLVLTDGGVRLSVPSQSVTHLTLVRMHRGFSRIE